MGAPVKVAISPDGSQVVVVSSSNLLIANNGSGDVATFTANPLI